MTYRVLTVCTGNICRSPMAQIVLAEAFAQVGMDVEVDSAGVSSEEHGNPIDYRAARILSSNGYEVPEHRARRMDARDLEEYDLVLPMTRQHEFAIERIARSAGYDISDPRYRDPALADVVLFRRFATDADQRHDYDLDVPDPWYGGESDFVETLDTVEDAVPGVIDYVRERIVSQ